jgi:O-phospho-L-seryl-tRNASec:L-selenocysteinyl-tRNA synthase
LTNACFFFKVLQKSGLFVCRARIHREKEREREKSFEEIDARVPQEHTRTHAERMFVNNDANQRLCESLVSSSYVRQADEATKRQSKLFSQLLSNRKLPTDGWNEHTIESFLFELAQLDSNNFLDNCGVGEREGRVYSKLVKRRNFGLHHGIGRSGDVSADQPKAIGSSIIAKLANILVTDAMKISGLRSIDCTTTLLLPLCTGMSLCSVFNALRAHQRKEEQGERRNRIVWTRLDQKTCIKSIQASGYDVCVVEPKLEGDELVTNLQALENELSEEDDNGRIACVVSSTSCFAPRASDDVEAIAKLCQKYNVAHVINNAYGVQSRKLCSKVDAAMRKGRVDCVVQSLDKNFLVPVGGAIVCAAKGNGYLVDKVRTLYPGRASISPTLDVLITLLEMGKNGYERLLDEREANYDKLKVALQRTASKYGERILETPNNPISLGVTLTSSRNDLVTKFGSMLFTRRVSGARTVPMQETKKIGDVELRGYGASFSTYPTAYFTAAAAIGMNEKEIESFESQLEKTFKDFVKLL